MASAKASTRSIHAFAADYATDRLRLGYIFGGFEEPYYTMDILPYRGRLP